MVVNSLLCDLLVCVNYMITFAFHLLKEIRTEGLDKIQIRVQAVIYPEIHSSLKTTK